MGKPTRDALVKRIKTLEKQISAHADNTFPKNPEYGFRTFTEQSPNMIFINKGGRIVYVNKRCVEVMGYSQEEFYAPDFDFMTLIAPESVELIRSNLKRHMAEKNIEPYEYSLLNKQGGKIEAIKTVARFVADDH